MLVLRLNADQRWVGTCAGAPHVTLTLSDVDRSEDGYDIAGKWVEGTEFEFDAQLEPA